MTRSRERLTRRVLIVSPHFPPVSTPDMQRVRLSLPHYSAYGWEPYVLGVAPTGEGEVVEPLLVDTIPRDVTIERVKPVPARLSRKVGVGDVAVRAFASLYRAGSRMIRDCAITLVYFSTTAFLAMPLGRIWKRQFSIPYVLDMQDPWYSDYYETHPHATPPKKYAVARRVHGVLEPWTMARVDGLVSVSSDYLDVLCRRYPRLGDVPKATITFGASSADFDLLARQPQPNRHFVPGDGNIHGVYVGRGGDDVAGALEILFRAFGRGRKSMPSLFDRVRLHFVGTDYASNGFGRRTVEPVAAKCGVQDVVSEDPARVPYFEALQLLVDADFLIVPGSDDPAYTPSKVYPYVLARKNILAVLHERSSAAVVLREASAGCVVTFASLESDREEAVHELAVGWQQVLEHLPLAPQTNWEHFSPYSARETTARQCELFNAVLDRRAS